MPLFDDTKKVLGEAADNVVAAEFIRTYMPSAQRKSYDAGEIDRIISKPDGLDLALEFDRIYGVLVHFNGHEGFNTFAGNLGLPGIDKDSAPDAFERLWGRPASTRPAGHKTRFLTFPNAGYRYDVNELSVTCEFDINQRLMLIAISRQEHWITAPR